MFPVCATLFAPVKRGLLRPFGRPDLLAEAMHGLLGDALRYRAMQAAALDWSNHFHWDNAAQRSLAVLTRLADTNTRNRCVR